MKQINKIRSALLGETPIFLANDGRAINELVIRHNKLFFMIDLDAETGLPTGDFGWSQDTPQTPTPVREHFKTVRLYGEVK